MSFLATLVIILIATTAVGHLFARFDLPAVIGQLLVGIVLGPAMLGWVVPSEFTHIFAEIGVIILMFIAGLESDLALLKRYLTPSIVVAVLGVIVPVVVTLAIGAGFGLHWRETLFLSVVFAATSVSISVAVMKELGVLDGKSGATVLGAAVVDDVLAVVILSVMIAVLGGGDQNVPLPLAFIEQGLYFVAIIVVVRFIAPLLAHLATKLQVPVGETLMALILCFGMAYVADLIGLSAVIGAFFAGIAVAQTPVRQTVAAHIEPIGYAVFIPVFFVSIGLNLKLAGLGQQIVLIAVLTLGAVLSKLIGAGLGSRLMKFSATDSLLVGTGMVARGEMALIIVQIGYTAKLIAPEHYTATVAAVILATLIAPFLIKYAARRSQI